MNVLVLLVCLAATAPLVAGVSALAVRKDLLDHPNQRSSHTTPTPRGGGIAFVVVVAAAAVLVVAGDPAGSRLATALLVGGLPVALVGLLDDVRDVAAPVRAAVHALAAAAAVLVLGGPGGGLPVAPVVLSVLAVVALVWLVNLYNFMDGIDGLAAGQAVVAAVGIALLTTAAHVEVAAWALAGAVGGFLLLNAPPAKIFMGDVGSGFLGMTLGVLALEASRSGGLPLWLSALLVGPFLVDATATLVRRALRGERWYAAHRDHAYQRLVIRGASHRAVSGGYVALAAVLAVEARLLRDLPAGWSAAAAAVTFAALLGAWASVRPTAHERSGPPD